MILQYWLKQTQKKAFHAEFSVFCEEKEIGRISFSSGTRKKQIWQGKVQDTDVVMRRLPVPSIFSPVYAPFEVELNGSVCGSLCKFRDGGWGAPLYYQQLELNQQVFQLYDLGCGKQGMKCPVLLDNQQIGLVTKEPRVQKELHSFAFYPQSDEQMLPILLLVCNYYFQKYYIGVGGSVSSTQYILTHDQRILDKSDEAFLQKIRDSGYPV